LRFAGWLPDIEKTGAASIAPVASPVVARNFRLLNGSVCMVGGLLVVGLFCCHNVKKFEQIKNSE
jgi:hypothetical protein